MLTYGLAWIIALASLGLYLTAAAFPEVHRKNDFILGGVGLFYALVLWANAKTIPVGLLIGQIASVTLIVWLGRQSVQQRSLLASPDIPRPEPGTLGERIRSLMIKIGQLWDPLVIIIGELLSSSLNRSPESEIIDTTSEAVEDAASSTNPFTKFGQSIAQLLKSDEVEQVSATVTVTASHDLAENGDGASVEQEGNGEEDVMVSDGSATTTESITAENPDPIESPGSLGSADESPDVITQSSEQPLDQDAEVSPVAEPSTDLAPESDALGATPPVGEEADATATDPAPDTQPEPDQPESEEWTAPDPLA